MVTSSSSVAVLSFSSSVSVSSYVGVGRFAALFDFDPLGDLNVTDLRLVLRVAAELGYSVSLAPDLTSDDGLRLRVFFFRPKVIALLMLRSVSDG